jgi:hypothetical protein
VREIVPGLHHWTAVHPRIHIEVSSYFLPAAGVLIDPLLPEGGEDALRALGEPRDVLLTNRHHYRHCAELERAFGCTVWCNEEGLHEFQKGERVRGFRAGETLPGDVRSFAVGAICPDETALLLPVEGGALAVADGVVRDGDGPLTFVPDFLLGDDPEGVKRGLRRAYARLCDEIAFDHLLPAHGTPWVGGAREALRAFCEG